MNNQITNKEIDAVNNNNNNKSTNKNLGPDGFTGKFHQIF